MVKFLLVSCLLSGLCLAAGKDDDGLSSRDRVRQRARIEAYQDGASGPLRGKALAEREARKVAEDRAALVEKTRRDALTPEARKAEDALRDAAAKRAVVKARALKIGSQSRR